MYLTQEVLKRTPVLTTTEMNILLLLVRYQDDDGLVIGVHYKDFMDELNFKSRQTFYNVLRSLKEKNFIEYTQNVKGDYDVVVLDNEGYTKQEDHDYINLNRNIFRDKIFYKMKGHEKYLLMKLMRLTAKNRGKYLREVKAFLEECITELQVTRRVIIQYLHTLKKYFSITIRKGVFVFSYLGGEDFKQPVESHTLKSGRKVPFPLTEAEQKYQHLAHVELRRHKIKECNKEDERDVGKLFFSQYKKEIEQSGHSNPLEYLRTFLHIYKEEFPDIFNIKHVHKKLRKVLGVE